MAEANSLINVRNKCILSVNQFLFFLLSTAPSILSDTDDILFFLSFKHIYITEETYICLISTFTNEFGFVIIYHPVNYIFLDK